MCNLLFNIPGRPCQREKIEWFWLADVDKLGNRNLYQPTNEYEEEYQEQNSSETKTKTNEHLPELSPIGVRLVMYPLQQHRAEMKALLGGILKN